MLSVQYVAKDLQIGINQAYDLFKQTDFSTVVVRKKKFISLPAYLLWKMNKKGKVCNIPLKGTSEGFVFFNNFLLNNENEQKELGE